MLTIKSLNETLSVSDIRTVTLYEDIFPNQHGGWTLNSATGSVQIPCWLDNFIVSHIDTTFGSSLNVHIFVPEELSFNDDIKSTLMLGRSIKDIECELGYAKTRLNNLEESLNKASIPEEEYDKVLKFLLDEQEIKDKSTVGDIKNKIVEMEGKLIKLNNELYARIDHIKNALAYTKDSRYNEIVCEIDSTVSN